jgi:hypothetical protein
MSDKIIIKKALLRSEIFNTKMLLIMKKHKTMDLEKINDYSNNDYLLWYKMYYRERRLRNFITYLILKI